MTDRNSCNDVSSLEECLLKEKYYLANNPDVIDFVKTAISVDSLQESDTVIKEASGKSVLNSLVKNDIVPNEISLTYDDCKTRSIKKCTNAFSAYSSFDESHVNFSASSYYKSDYDEGNTDYVSPHNNDIMLNKGLKKSFTESSTTRTKSSVPKLEEPVILDEKVNKVPSGTENNTISSNDSSSRNISVCETELVTKTDINPICPSSSKSLVNLHIERNCSEEDINNISKLAEEQNIYLKIENKNVLNEISDTCEETSVDTVCRVTKIETYDHSNQKGTKNSAIEMERVAVSQLEEVASDNEVSLKDKIKSVCINATDFSKKLNFEIPLDTENANMQRIQVDPESNCAISTSDNTFLNSEKVLKDKLNTTKSFKCSLNKDSADETFADNESLGIIPHCSKFQKKLSNSEELTVDLKPSCDGRSPIKNNYNTLENCGSSPSKCDKLVCYMNVLCISNDIDAMDGNESNFLVNNSSNLHFPKLSLCEVPEENIYQALLEASQQNDVREIPSLHVKQEVLEEFNSFENCEMQVASNQIDLVQSFKPECNYECDSNEELLSMMNEGIRTPECLNEIESIVNEFNGVLSSQIFSQSQKEMEVQETETCDAVEECDDCLSLFADSNEKGSLEWETLSEASKISEPEEDDADFSVSLSKARKLIHKNNKTINSLKRGTVKIIKESFNKEVKDTATEDIRNRANKRIVTEYALKDSSDDAVSHKTKNACEFGTKYTEEETSGNMTNYLENGNKRILGFFKDFCFHYLRKSICLEKYCKYLHEIPDILKLNAGFEEEMQYAKENNFLYFIRKSCETLMNEAFVNNRKGMWKKVFTFSNDFGVPTDQFIKQLIDQISSISYKDSFSFSELLTSLISNNLLNDSLGGIKIFSNLDHNLIPNKLLSRLLDAMYSKIYSATLCKELYDDLLVHIPVPNFENIPSFNIENFTSSLEYFGLYEESHSFRSKYNRFLATSENASHHHVHVNKKQNSFEVCGTVGSQSGFLKSPNKSIHSKGNRTMFLELADNKLNEVNDKGHFRVSTFENNFYRRQKSSKILHKVYTKERNKSLTKNVRSSKRNRQLKQSTRGIRKLTVDKNYFMGLDTNSMLEEQLHRKGISHKKLPKMSQKSCLEHTLDKSHKRAYSVFSSTTNTKGYSSKSSHRQMLLKRKYEPWKTPADLRYTLGEKRAKINDKLEHCTKIAFTSQFQQHPCSVFRTQEITPSLIQPEKTSEQNVYYTDHSNYFYRTESNIKMRYHTNSMPFDHIIYQHKKDTDSTHLPQTRRAGSSYWNPGPLSESRVMSPTRHEYPELKVDLLTLYRMIDNRDWKSVLETCKQLRGNSGSGMYTWQVYRIFKEDLKRSDIWFSFLVQEAGMGSKLPLYIEDFLSTIGTNLMLDLIDRCYWKLAYNIFTIMRSSKIDIRFSEVYKEEKFSPCRKILMCVLICFQVDAMEEAIALLEHNRMLSPEVNEWQLESIGQDFKLWLWICTALLNSLLVSGPLELAQYLFLKLLKKQENLFTGIDLNRFCDILMIKLLNGDYIEEALELYYFIKPHFHILGSNTYRALLVILVSQSYMEMAQRLFEGSVLTNIYPCIELKQQLLQIILYSDFLHEEIYMILKNFFHHLLKERFWDLQVNPNPTQYKVVIVIRPKYPPQSLKDFPNLLTVDCSLNAIQNRLCEVLNKSLPEMKYYMDERCLDDVVLDPMSVIKHLQSNLYLPLSHYGFETKCPENSPNI